MERDEARQALDAMQDAKDKLADVAVRSPWYSAAVGVVMATMILAESTNGEARGPLVIAALVGAIVLVAAEKSRAGIFVIGLSNKRTRPAVVALIAVMIGVLVFARNGADASFPSTSGMIAAAITFLVAAMGSMWIRRLYVTGLRAGGAK